MAYKVTFYIFVWNFYSFLFVNALHSIKINCRIPSLFVSALNFDLYTNFLQSFTHFLIYALYVLINSQNNYFNEGKTSIWLKNKCNEQNREDTNSVWKTEKTLYNHKFDWCIRFWLSTRSCVYSVIKYN